MRLRLLLLGMFICLLSCTSKTDKNKTDIVNTDQTSQTKKMIDYDFLIKCYDSRVGIYKVLKFESNDNKQDGFNIIHSQYVDENMNKLDKELIDFFKVSEEQLNSIYKRLITQVTPKSISNEKIPPIKVSDNEWRYGTIELDLKYRGDKYQVTTGNYIGIVNYILSFDSMK